MHPQPMIPRTIHFPEIPKVQVLQVLMRASVADALRAAHVTLAGGSMDT